MMPREISSMFASNYRPTAKGSTQSREPHFEHRSRRKRANARMISAKEFLRGPRAQDR